MESEPESEKNITIIAAQDDGEESIESCFKSIRMIEDSGCSHYMTNHEVDHPQAEVRYACVGDGKFIKI